MKFTTEERIFIVKNYYKTSRASVIEKWQDNFETEPPSVRQINKVVKKFERIGTVQDAPRCGRPRTVDTPENREMISTFLVETPTTSSRKAPLQLPNYVSRTSYQRITKRLKFKCYHPRLVHGLLEDDPDRRLQFCELMLNQYQQDRDIFGKIIWSDEAQFKLNGFVNRHNCIYYDTENPRLIWEKQLNQPGFQVWGGMSLSGVYGPYFFEGNVTGAAYHEMLEQYLLPGLHATFGDGPNGNGFSFNDMYFQHDGAPAHCTNLIRDSLNNEFDYRIIGRRGYIDWPPRSPDLTCMDFYFWGTVKDLVYARKPINLADLRRYIEDAFEEIESNPIQRRRVIESVPERLQACVNGEGSHFEHLLG